MTHLFSLPVAEREAASGGRHARKTGRSWWSLHYMSGRIIHEWDPDVGSSTGHMDWIRMASLGALQRIDALRIYCPNGRMAQLSNPQAQDATGRLFQLKVAVRSVEVRANGVVSNMTRQVHAHIIGVLTGRNGECTIYAWEPLAMPEPPEGAPPRPVRPNYFNREQPAWALKEQHERYLGETRLFEEFMSGDAMKQWHVQVRDWESNARGRLVGPYQDNVYMMQYHGLGMLNADHLGLADGEGR